MSIIRIAERPLSEGERDDKNAQSLLRSSRKPHKSRKHKERRAPREQQQKSRVTVEDDDIKKTDSDLSLGRRFNSADIAFRIMVSADDEIFEPELAEVKKLLQKASPALLKKFEDHYDWAKSEPTTDTSARVSADVPSDTKKTPDPTENVDLLAIHKNLIAKVLEVVAPTLNKFRKEGKEFPEEILISSKKWDGAFGSGKASKENKVLFSGILQSLGIADDFRAAGNTHDIKVSALKKLHDHFGELTTRINEAKNIKSLFPKEDSESEPAPTSKSPRARSDSRILILTKIKNDANRIARLSKSFSSYPTQLITDVEDYWDPEEIETPPFGQRAGILLSLQSWLKKQASILPQNVRALAKSLFSSDVETSAENFAQKLLDSKRKINKEDVKNEEFLSWAVGFKLWEELHRTGEWVKDTKKFKKTIDQFTSQVYKLMGTVLEAQKLDEALQQLESKGSDSILRAIEEGDRTNLPKDIEARLDEYDKAFQGILEGAQESSKAPMSKIDKLNAKALQSINDEMSDRHKVLSRKSSSSYKTVVGRMNKTATYHGIVQQGHPNGPYSGWTYLDKRELNQTHFKNILAAAKDFLGGTWLKTSWDGGSSDAQVRAALDMAIHTADGAAYQSKIDAPTYNMLLNELAGYGLDLFQDTLIPPTKTGKVASMASPALELLRVAREIESSHPHLALQIVTNVHALAGDVHVASDDGTIALPVKMLTKLAFDNPGTRSVLVPIIAAKRKSMKKKSTKKKVSMKKESSESASEEPKKASKKKKAGKSRKASVELFSNDTSW